MRNFSYKYETTPEQRRAYRLRWRYGLTVEEYDLMVAAQDGKCAICGLVPSEKLRVDHDHSTGAVRALLCNGCNVSIGHMREDRAALQGAINYLDSHSASSR